MVKYDMFGPIPFPPERKPRPYTTYDYIAGLLNGNNTRDVIGELNVAVSAIAEAVPNVHVHDTQLENINATLADIQTRLVALETLTKITPAPSPTPKPIPEPKPIPVPDIVPVIVKPVEPVKTVKQSVKKRKTKGQIEKKTTTSKKK